MSDALAIRAADILGVTRADIIKHESRGSNLVVVVRQGHKYFVPLDQLQPATPVPTPKPKRRRRKKAVSK